MNHKKIKSIALITVSITILVSTFSFAQSGIEEFFKNENIFPEISGVHNIWQTLFSFSLAGLLGLIVSFRRNVDTYGFAVMESHIILSFAAALMMMIIGSDLARAFGLMGAAAIVRYRYSLNTPQEASSLIFALGLGMACGVGLYGLAIIGVIFARLGQNMFDMIPLSIINFFFNVREVMILKISIATDKSFYAIEEVEEILIAEKLKFRLISSKERRAKPEITTLTFEVVVDTNGSKDRITKLIRDRISDVGDVLWIKQRTNKIDDNFSSRNYTISS